MPVFVTSVASIPLLKTSADPNGTYVCTIMSFTVVVVIGFSALLFFMFFFLLLFLL